MKFSTHFHSTVKIYNTNNSEYQSILRCNDWGSNNGSNILALDDYWLMVAGKTAALLAFCLEVGVLSAKISADIKSNYRDFGHYLGLAFQIQDDILGIWGE